MKKTITPIGLLAVLSFAVGCGGNESSDTNTTDSTTTTMQTPATESGSSTTDSTSSAGTNENGDKTFVLEAASGGLMEVTLGKYAAQNAASPKVKEFGQMMVTDHTKANTELKAVAAKKNIQIPTAPAEEQQKHIDELMTKKGADFDKAYVDMMVDDHEEDISKFETEASGGADADIKKFATKTLPVLKKHAASIKSIKDAMKQ